MPESTKDKNTSFQEKFFEYVKISAIVFTALLGYKNVIVDDKNALINELKLQQDSTVQGSDINLKMCQLSIDVLKSKDAKQQKAACVAIKCLVKDSVLQSNLLDIFGNSDAVESSVRDVVTVTKFELSDLSKNPSKISTSKTYIDVFYYLKNEKETKKIAQKLRDALRSSSLFEVGQVKPFSVAKNTEKYYHVLETNNEIRYDTDELKYATLLKELGDKLLLEEGMRLTLKPAGLSKPSKSYMSLFIMDTNSEYNDK